MKRHKLDQMDVKGVFYDHNDKSQSVHTTMHLQILEQEDMFKCCASEHHFISFT